MASRLLDDNGRVLIGDTRVDPMDLTVHESWSQLAADAGYEWHVELRAHGGTRLFGAPIPEPRPDLVRLDRPAGEAELLSVRALVDLVTTLSEYGARTAPGAAPGELPPSLAPASWDGLYVPPKREGGAGPAPIGAGVISVIAAGFLFPLPIAIGVGVVALVVGAVLLVTLHKARAAPSPLGGAGRVRLELWGHGDTVELELTSLQHPERSERLPCMAVAAGVDSTGQLWLRWAAGRDRHLDIRLAAAGEHALAGDDHGMDTARNEQLFPDDPRSFLDAFRDRLGEHHWTLDPSFEDLAGALAS